MKMEPVYKTSEKKQAEEECSNTRLDNEHKNDGRKYSENQIWKDCKKKNRQTHVSAIVH